MCDGNSIGMSRILRHWREGNGTDMRVEAQHGSTLEPLSGQRIALHECLRSMYPYHLRAMLH